MLIVKNKIINLKFGLILKKIIILQIDKKNKMMLHDKYMKKWNV